MHQFRSTYLFTSPEIILIQSSCLAPLITTNPAPARWLNLRRHLLRHVPSDLLKLSSQFSHLLPEEIQIRFNYLYLSASSQPSFRHCNSFAHFGWPRKLALAIQ